MFTVPSSLSLTSAGEMAEHHRCIEIAPGARLRLGRIHEVTGTASDMFALLSGAKSEAQMIWIGLGRDLSTLCPTGFEHHLDISNMVLVEGVSRGEILWVADQALRANGGFTVVLDMPDALSLKESRRLQLAAEQGGGLGLILLRGPAITSAAQTRWACEPIPEAYPAWDWVCLKGKNGEIGRWRVTDQEDQNATDTLHMAATAAP